MLSSSRAETSTPAAIAARFDQMMSLFSRDSDTIDFIELFEQALRSCDQSARDQQVLARSQSTEPQQVPASGPSIRPQQVPRLRFVPASIYLDGQRIPSKVHRVLRRAMARRAALINAQRHRFPSRRPQVQQDPSRLQVPPRVSPTGAKASHPTAARQSVNGPEQGTAQSIPRFIGRLLAKLPLSKVPRVMRREVYRLLQHNDPTLTALSAQEAATLRSSLRSPYDALSYLVAIDQSSLLWNDIEAILGAHPNEHFDSLSQVLKLIFGYHTLVPEQESNALGNETEDLLVEFYQSLEGDANGHDARNFVPTLEAQARKLRAELARLEQAQAKEFRPDSNSHMHVSGEPACPFLAEIRASGPFADGAEVRFPLDCAVLDSPCIYLAKYARQLAGTTHEVPNCWLVRPKTTRSGAPGFTLKPHRRHAYFTGRGN